MSAEYKGQNPLDIAKQAEKDLNSHANVHGTDPNSANPNRGPQASDSGMCAHIRYSPASLTMFKQPSPASMSLQSTSSPAPPSQ